MSFINFSDSNKNEYTLVSNNFIDNYLPQANANYIKIYLYILRLNSQKVPVSIANIASDLDLIESDIIRALKNLDENGVLTFVKRGDGYLLSFDNNRFNDNDDTMIEPEEEVKPVKKKATQKASMPKPMVKHTPIYEEEYSTQQMQFDEFIVEDEEEIAQVYAKPKKASTDSSTYDATELNYMVTRNPQISQLVGFIESTYGSTFTPSNSAALIQLMDDSNIKIGLDGFKSLVAYAFDNKSFTKINSLLKYLETKAYELTEKNILEVDQIDNYLLTSTKNYREIFKYLGINSSPTQLHITYMSKWLYEYKMPLELIILACEKTITKINQANFSYIDAILSNWKSMNILSIDDLTNSNTQNKFVSKNTIQASTPRSNGSKKFTACMASQTDYSELEDYDQSFLTERFRG